MTGRPRNNLDVDRRTWTFQARNRRCTGALTALAQDNGVYRLALGRKSGNAVSFGGRLGDSAARALDVTQVLGLDAGPASAFQLASWASK